jgi:glutathione S-transferase
MTSQRRPSSFARLSALKQSPDPFEEGIGMPILHGVSVSPYVRKAFVALTEKSVEFEERIVLPTQIPDDYYKISPLGKIPCFQDGDFALADSSAIIAYLEKAHPETPLYPVEAKEHGRAVWYEEYADTKLASVLLVPFFEFVVKPKLMGQDPDKARVEKALGKELPRILDYLEAEIGDKEWFAGGQFSVADIAIASPFVNFQYAKQSVSQESQPKVAAFLKRVLARPSFQSALAKDAAFFAQGK